MRTTTTIGMLTILLSAEIAMSVGALESATNSPVNTLFSSAVFGVTYCRATLAEGVDPLRAEDELYAYLERTRPAVAAETNAPPLRERDRVALALNDLLRNQLRLTFGAEDDAATRERRIEEFLDRIDAMRTIRNILPSGWHIAARSGFRPRGRNAFGETEHLLFVLIDGQRRFDINYEGETWVFLLPSSFTPETTRTNVLNNPGNFLMDTAQWKIYLVGSTATHWITMRDDLRNAFQREDGRVPTKPPTVQ